MLEFISSLESVMPPATPEPTITHYSAGFLFSHAKDRVLLIRKNRPAWMHGMLNGIGGHIEPGETPHDCMVRECKEETGLDVPEWKQFVTLRIPSKAVIHFFASTGPVFHARKTTDEELYLAYTAEVNSLHTIPNLRWLIPMALRIDEDHIESYEITEQ
jgi:8-oxo-dGTP diphosphatase